MADAFNDPDSLEAPEYDASSEHPTPEFMLMRQAVKYLTPKQKKVWELHNYDRLTQAEIGKKLHISQSTVAEHIAACEARITRWCKSNMGVYELLKREYGEK